MFTRLLSFIHICSAFKSWTNRQSYFCMIIILIIVVMYSVTSARKILKGKGQLRNITKMCCPILACYLISNQLRIRTLVSRFNYCVSDKIECFVRAKMIQRNASLRIFALDDVSRHMLVCSQKQSRFKKKNSFCTVKCNVSGSSALLVIFQS